MTVLAPILAEILWVCCGVKAYLRVRSYYRAKGWGWSTGDRRAALMLSVLGPVGLLIDEIVRVEPKEEKEAKW